MKKVILAMTLSMLIGAVFMFLLYYLLASRDDVLQAVCVGLSFSALFPIMWFYGFTKPSKGDSVTRGQVKRISLVALVVVAVIVFAFCMTVIGWSLLKSSVYAIITPVAGMGIGGLLFLIFRPDKNLPPVQN